MSPETVPVPSDGGSIVVGSEAKEVVDASKEAAHEKATQRCGASSSQSPYSREERDQGSADSHARPQEKEVIEMPPLADFLIGLISLIFAVRRMWLAAQRLGWAT
jgi:hypothetical protein